MDAPTLRENVGTLHLAKQVDWEQVVGGVC